MPRVLNSTPSRFWRTGRVPWIAGAAVLIVWMGVVAPLLSAGEWQQWTFQEDPTSEPPRGWEVLSGAWEVRAAANGDNRVLAQVGPPLPGLDLPAILAPMPPVRDLRATVKLKPVGVGAFKTMGLIIRWRDAGTLTILRVDGTPGRVWLERLQGGERSLRAGYIVPLYPDRWNTVRVTARGDWLNLFLNGVFLGGVREDDPVPGRIGLMAGPGGRVLLDDLEVELTGRADTLR